MEEPFTLEGLADAVHEATRRWEEKDSIFRKARDVVLKVTDKLGSFQVLFSIFPDQSIYTASLCKAVKALFVVSRHGSSSPGQHFLNRIRQQKATKTPSAGLPKDLVTF